MSYLNIAMYILILVIVMRMINSETKPGIKPAAEGITAVRTVSVPANIRKQRKEKSRMDKYIPKQPDFTDSIFHDLPMHENNYHASTEEVNGKQSDDRDEYIHTPEYKSISSSLPSYGYDHRYLNEEVTRRNDAKLNLIDHYTFKDNVNESSRLDSGVNRINEYYEDSQKASGMRLRDIYDSLTSDIRGIRNTSPALYPVAIPYN